MCHGGFTLTLYKGYLFWASFKLIVGNLPVSFNFKHMNSRKFKIYFWASHCMYLGHCCLEGLLLISKIKLLPNKTCTQKLLLLKSIIKVSLGPHEIKSGHKAWLLCFHFVSEDV